MSKGREDAYEWLYTTARNILELAEQIHTGEYIVDSDNITDLADAHAAVHHEKNKDGGMCFSQFSKGKLTDSIDKNISAANMTLKDIQISMDDGDLKSAVEFSKNLMSQAGDLHQMLCEVRGRQIAKLDLDALAKQYRENNPDLGKGGVVIIYKDEIQGWSSKLRDPNRWIAGCIAVDPEGNKWKTVGGDYQNGAERWEPIKKSGN